MDISWSTVFSSIGASVGACAFLGWLCREWISARLHKSIQHEYDKKFADYEAKVQHEYDKKFADYEAKVQHKYDKKFADYETKVHHMYDERLEDFKSRIQFEYNLKLESSKMDFQKVLDEHQTQFKYWFDEKTKAIKELHTNAGDLFYSLCYLHTIESNPSQQWGDSNREEIEKELKQHVYLNMQKTINEWINLRLFLDDNEDKVFKEFSDITQMWFRVLLNPDSEQRIKYIEDNQLIMLKDIESVLNKLRTCFQASLKNDISIFQRQNDDALKVSKSHNEVK